MLLHACCHEILNVKLQVGKQTALDSFFKREPKELKPLTAEPEPGLSGIQVKKTAETTVTKSCQVRVKMF
jgi:hypothetical protein